MAGRQLDLLQSNLSLNQLPRKTRTFRQQLDPLTSYTDSEIMPETNRNHAVSAEMQVLITLRSLASGSFLQVIGDTFLGFDKSTVSRVVRRVTQAKICESWRFHQISVNES